MKTVDISGTKYQIVRSYYPDTKQLRVSLINLDNEKPVIISIADKKVAMDNGDQFLVAGEGIGKTYCDLLVDTGVIEHVRKITDDVNMYVLKDKEDILPPGEIILKKFLEPHGITQTTLATSLNLSWNSINSIVTGKRSIVSTTAVRLAKFFGWTTPEYWTSLQTRYDSSRILAGDTHTKLEHEASEALAKIHPFRPDPRKIK